MIFSESFNVGTKSTRISDGDSLEPATKKKRTSYESVSLPEGRYSVVLSYIIIQYNAVNTNTKGTSAIVSAGCPC